VQRKEIGHEKKYQQSKEDAGEAAEGTPEAERQGDEKGRSNAPKYGKKADPTAGELGRAAGDDRSRFLEFETLVQLSQV
jgi:hypothetical protein